MDKFIQPELIICKWKKSLTSNELESTTIEVEQLEIQHFQKAVIINLIETISCNSYDREYLNDLIQKIVSQEKKLIIR